MPTAQETIRIQWEAACRLFVAVCVTEQARGCCYYYSLTLFIGFIYMHSHTYVPVSNKYLMSSFKITRFSIIFTCVSRPSPWKGDFKQLKQVQLSEHPLQPYCKPSSLVISFNHCKNLKKSNFHFHTIHQRIEAQRYKVIYSRSHNQEVLKLEFVPKQG